METLLAIFIRTPSGGRVSPRQMNRIRFGRLYFSFVCLSVCLSVLLGNLGNVCQTRACLMKGVASLFSKVSSLCKVHPVTLTLFVLFFSHAKGVISGSLKSRAFWIFSCQVQLLHLAL